MCKELDKRKNIKVVTTNNFVSIKGLESLSVKARKLLYIAIAQCHLEDTEFFEYEITCTEFAQMTGVQVQNLYNELNKATDELLDVKLIAKNDKEEAFAKYSMFSYCIKSPGNGAIRFKLNSDMAPFLLGIKKGFCQPLLSDFIRMRSTYSMAIWHMMQREMGSKKPAIGKPMRFQLTVEEIRKETGTENKFKKINDFKRFVLFQAIREIENNCDVAVTATDVKQGKSIVAFNFDAISIFDDILSRTEKREREKREKEEKSNYIKIEKEPELFLGDGGQIELRLGWN